MLSDNFMFFPQESGSQIQGETTDQYFVKKGAFELTTFRFDITNDESTEESGGANAGKAKFGKFTINKWVDTASVPLYKACCKATIFPSIMLAVRKAGGSNLLFMQYIFRYNQILEINWEGGNGQERPRETITIAFKAMGVQYIPQMPDGRPGTPQQWSWNTTDQGTSSLEISGIESAPKFLSSTNK